MPGRAISSKYLIFVYLFCFSFLSLAHLRPAHFLALIGLYIMLVIYSVNATTNNYLRLAVMVFSHITVIWGCWIEILKHLDFSFFSKIKHWAD